MTWLSSCGGCEESILDVGLDLADLLERVDLVYWPFGMDGRLEDLHRVPDGGLDAALVNGSVRTFEHVETARLLRRKARIVAAQGSCAHLGGVYGLADLFSMEAVLERSYGSAPPGGESGKGASTVPRLLDRVKPLGNVVEVDVVIPGCPPVPGRVREAIEGLIQGTLAKGTVLAEDQALCRTCPRRETRRPDTRIRRFRRIHEAPLDPDLCFLEQGIVCLGPVTRGGCEARCIGGNLPCRGCFGPVGQGEDPGGGAVGLLAALAEGAFEGDPARALDSLVDPAGLFYRYSLPSSLLGGGGGGDDREP
jgi:F420-non-reducing hydrogenase small subunit